MNINEILEKHYNSCKAYSRTYNDSYFKATYKRFVNEAIKEIVEKTLEMAAENAKLKKQPDAIGFQDIIAVDKDSITKTINQIKF